MTDDFDTILDHCLADLTAGRSIEACLRHYPQQAAQLEPLLKIASHVRAFPAVADLSQERVRAIELRLLDRAAQLPRPQVNAVPRRSSRLRWVPAAFALVIVCSFVSFGVTSASSASLPGETLYPVKRFSEGVAGVLTPATGQADLHVALAQRRLNEFLTLADRNDVRPDLLLERSSEMALALGAADNAPEIEQAVVLERVATATEQQMQQLSVALASAPAVSRDSLETALVAASTEHDRVVELLATRVPHADPPALTTTATSTPDGSGPDTPTPTLAMPVATPTPVLAISEPTDEAQPSVTPPGQGTPGPKVTPPGQGTPGPKVTPPGQGTPKSKVTPPGQGTPKPKETSSSEQGDPGAKKDPPGQGGGGGKKK